MARLRVQNNLTLDGVMQAPGGVDEDRRDGFRYGGWAQPYFDPVMAEAAGESMSQGGRNALRATDLRAVRVVLAKPT